jgi:Family of unknown function (DUF5309)
MSTSNLDSADLKGALRGGLIREDLMDTIFDISNVPLPFTDMVGKETARNSYKEWVTRELAAPSLANALVDGADASGNDTVMGTRVGNHHQISGKVVRVSFRAEESDSVGRIGKLAEQIMERQKELRRDVEATALANQASVAGTESVASKVGGLPSWIVTAHTNGTAGGYSTGTGLTVARTLTTRSALTETKVRNNVQTIYQNGGDPSVLMTVPEGIARISEFLFTSNARVATLMSDQGKSQEAATALGAVSVFVTDFGTLRLTPNRIQQKHLDSGGVNLCADVFILDPSYLALSYLGGYKTKQLARTGLAENWQMSVDWSLIVKNEKSQGIIGDIDVTAAMTA